MLFGKQSGKLLDDLLRRVARRIGVVDHRIVRFCEREDDAVEFRADAERLFELVAEPFLIILSEQVKFAILVQQSRKIVKKAVGDEYLAMPIV